MKNIKLKLFRLTLHFYNLSFLIQFIRLFKSFAWKYNAKSIDGTFCERMDKPSQCQMEIGIKNRCNNEANRSAKCGIKQKVWDDSIKCGMIDLDCLSHTGSKLFVDRRFGEFSVGGVG